MKERGRDGVRGEDRRRRRRSQKPKVHLMLRSCHVGIKGSDLTAESTNLEVLMFLEPILSCQTAC